MKKLCLSLLLCALPLVSAFAQTDGSNEKNYFTYDFENGIGEDFRTYDRDGLTLYFTMIQAGFTQGDSWIALKEEGVDNYYAASASKYKFAKGEEPKPADDWLVTPLVWVEGDNAVLTWRGMSVCSQSTTRSGYEVRVSTTGNKPEDFTDAPVCIVEADPANSWQAHEVSLGQYKGKKIYVAFINNNLNKEILAIDDIVMKGGRGLCDLTVNTPDVVYGAEDVRVSATLTANTDESITGFTAYCTWNEQTFVKEVKGVSLKKGDSCTFSFDETIPANSGDTVSYEVWAEVNGLTLTKERRQTVVMLFETHRKIVFEEGTGMWCGYCPKGIVAMDILQKKYPETFLGLAIHYDDALALNGYVAGIGIPSFPSAWVNRKYLNSQPMVMVGKPGIYEYTTLSGGFETDFLKAREEPAVANVDVTARDMGKKVEVTAVTRFALSNEGHTYRLAVVFVEDSVSRPEYYQKNYFSGTDIPLGGYEKLPQTISPVMFNHVVRGIYDDWKGIPGSVPESVELGKTYTFSYQVTPPASILSRRHTRIVVLLIDETTGEIANANEVDFPVSSGIGEVSPSDHSVKCMQEGDECVVTWQSVSAAPAEVSLYDLKGTLLWKSVSSVEQGAMSCRIPLHRATGTHIVSLRQGNHVRVVKICFK